MSYFNQARWDAIRELYLTWLKREPDEAGIQEYYDSGKSIEDIRKSLQASDEYYRLGREPRFSTDAGIRPDLFGGADYIAALEAGGSQNVRTTRLNVLDWLRGEGVRWLDPRSKPGYLEDADPGRVSLFDKIEAAGSNRQISPRWGDKATTDEVHKFTAADLLATRAMKFSDEDIRSELDRNLDWLREEDKPGVEGGLYESLFLQRDEDTYVPPRPEVTRNPSEYNVNIPRKTISQPERDSLKMTPGQAFIGKTASGVGTAKRTRKRVRQTTDLQRSLNIS